MTARGVLRGARRWTVAVVLACLALAGGAWAATLTVDTGADPDAQPIAVEHILGRNVGRRTAFAPLRERPGRGDGDGAGECTGENGTFHRDFLTLATM